MTVRTRPPPALDRMIRVDQAGEYGAVRIYRGQRAVFAHVPAHARTLRLIEEMEAEEKEHLASFAALAERHAARPSALMPLWHAAAFALGAATALISPRAAMACTVAVEEVIDRHYAEQIAELAASREQGELKKTLEKFRAQELAHRDLALRAGARQAAGFPLLSGAVAAVTRAAIALSSRF